METTIYLKRGAADSNLKYSIQYVSFSHSKDNQIEFGEDSKGLSLGRWQFRSQTSFG